MIPSQSPRVLTFDEFVKHSEDALSLGNDPSEISGLTDAGAELRTPTKDGEKVNTTGTTGNKASGLSMPMITPVPDAAAAPDVVVAVSDETGTDDTENVDDFDEFEGDDESNIEDDIEAGDETDTDDEESGSGADDEFKFDNGGDKPTEDDEPIDDTDREEGDEW